MTRYLLGSVPPDIRLQLFRLSVSARVLGGKESKKIIKQKKKKTNKQESYLFQPKLPPFPLKTVVFFARSKVHGTRNHNNANNFFSLYTYDANKGLRRFEFNAISQ